MELDPKRDDLAMGRVKHQETDVEARTVEGWKLLGWPVVRSERLIKFRDSWFSSKYI